MNGVLFFIVFIEACCCSMPFTVFLKDVKERFFRKEKFIIKVFIFST